MTGDADPYATPSARLRSAHEHWLVPFVVRTIVGCVVIPLFFVVFGEATGRGFPDFILEHVFIALLAASGVVASLLLVPLGRTWPGVALAASPLVTTLILGVVAWSVNG